LEAASRARLAISTLPVTALWDIKSTILTDNRYILPPHVYLILRSRTLSMRSLVLIACRIVLAVVCLPADTHASALRFTSHHLRAAATAAPPSIAPLTTAAEIRALTDEQASEGRPVHLHGIVTFYDRAQQVFFFEDSTGPMYLEPGRDFPVVAGSRVEVWGTTSASYTTQVEASRVVEISRGPLPVPVFVDFETASRHVNDCRFVTMEGIVRSATVQQVGPARIYLLQFEVDHRLMEVAISNFPPPVPLRLLDATVRVTGNLGGNFNKNDQIVGLQLMVTDLSQVRVLKPAPGLRNLPITPLHTLLRSEVALSLNHRIRTRGVVTLYDQGEKLVIKDVNNKIGGANNLLVQTRQEDPIAIGQSLEVTGFPAAINGSPALDNAQFIPVGGVTPLRATTITFDAAISGKYANDLIALEGEIVSETRESHLDTLILRSGKRVFQAVYRKSLDQADPIPVYQPGTHVRVTGVCTIHARGFWGAVESFQIQLRSADDIIVLGRPSWWTISRLFVLISALLTIALFTLAWGVWMRRRLSDQERLLRQKAESESARLATTARLERQRSHILELINSFEPLPSVLTAIHQYVSDMWPGVFSYTHVLQNRKLVLIARSHLKAVDQARLQIVDPGNSSEACANAVRSRSLIPFTMPHNIWSRPLISSQGEILGTMTFEAERSQPVSLNVEAFEFGCNLAAIAIDNRRLYEDVVHRSQHDQLTGLPNRALLDTRLDEALAGAGKNRRNAAVLFLDLDDFKAVNDTYTHRIGDLYLCEVARRFLTCLRDCDTLGRVGGDEFVAVIADLADPSQALNIAERLVQSLQTPIRVEELVLHGTVSIGMAIFPECGSKSAELKHHADAAMYAAKRAGGNQFCSPAALPAAKSLFAD
jgi:diguanylate cyclase (GGDEF)-like protein